MNYLIDTHSHIYAEEFDADRDEAIRRAREAGVERLLLPAIDSESHGRLFDTVRRYPDHCTPMMGLHPTSINDNPRWREELALVERYLCSPPEGVGRFCAVGEIGLDLYWSRDFREEQAEAFRRQITVASPEQTFSSFGALREWISNSLLLFTQSRQAAASQDTAVATVKAYIESHLSDELDRDTLAAMVYLNADYLSHLFKKDTGSSLINYIIDRRIAHSKELLAKGEMSIRDIAITCGFQNISYFSRQFKKSTGMTPRQFKN